MYYRRNVFDKTTETVAAPFPVVQDDNTPDETDTATTPPITIDETDNFEGRVSPRVMQWLVDQVKALKP